MQKKDINARFAEWLCNPVEAMDFEAKQWLDLANAEHQGLIAKALIALENHGGGYLVFGFAHDSEKKLTPDPNRPTSLKSYSTDGINAIVRKRAEPSFHVEVTIHDHPDTGDSYPIVRVTGASRVPVRSCSATEGKALVNNVYYVRAPGPESRGPENASEWTTLLQRALLNQRDDILAVLRTFLPALSGVAPSSTEHPAILDAFASSAFDRWLRLNAKLPIDAPARNKRGYYAFSAHIVGKLKGLSQKEILGANDRARRYTGWPVFIAIYRDDMAPHPIGDRIEVWLGKDGQTDVAHADFWQIDTSGNFILIRGFQEDAAGELGRSDIAPGTILEVTLPVWRVGEFLLRVAELGEYFCEDEPKVEVRCLWFGLEGRALRCNNFRWDVPTYTCNDASIESTGEFSVAAIRDLLPEVVKTLTLPLYNAFEFYRPTDPFFKEELKNLTGRSF